MDPKDGVNLSLGGAYEYPVFEQPQLQNGDVAMPSPDSKPPSKLQLPMSCDPPGPGNPAKQLVWIVSPPSATQSFVPTRDNRLAGRYKKLTNNLRSSAAQDIWAAPSSAPASTKATSS